MHDGQVTITADQVRLVIADQFEQYDGLPVWGHDENGTDHRLFRVGQRLLARMPIVDWAADQALSDQQWLPRLARHLPLAVPEPIAVGKPGRGYPYPWSLVRWLLGEALGDPLQGEALLGDTARLRGAHSRKNPPPARPVLNAARQLGEFVTALQRIDPAGGPAVTGVARGTPLARHDERVREALDQTAVLQANPTHAIPHIDVVAATVAWERALDAPPAARAVWLHGDLLPGNILADCGRLTAVIDWGAVGVGDGAVDLAPARWLFARRSRQTFLTAATMDLLPAELAAAVERARGWVLIQAIIGLPYYAECWPEFATACAARLGTLLADAA